MSENKGDTELIRKLKEQVHKSFMQISQMEKLFHLEMQHTKEQFDQRQRLIKQKQEDIKQKYAQIENNMRMKQSSFLLQMGELDMSIGEITYKNEDPMRDSGIQKIAELLSSERKHSSADPEAQLNKLRELQLFITSCLTNVPVQLYQLFQISKELCLDNCRLKEQLLNYQQTHDVYKTQIFECEKMVEKLKRNEKSLKQHNQQLNDLYVQEASQNAIVEEQIRKVKLQLNLKKSEVDSLRQQVSKLSDLLKTSNRIDISKINFKYPLNNKSREQAPEKQKINPLRMSSNAVLMRNYKPITPQTCVGQQPNISVLSPQFPNAESGPKYFKKKVDRIDRLLK